MLGGPVETLSTHDDRAGSLLTRDYIHTLIAAEVAAGIPHDRIVLGGFSQGGAVALLAGLTAPSALAAIVGMSCWLTLSKTFRDEQGFVPEGNPPNTKTPVLLCHGDEDKIVRYSFGEATAKLLKELGYSVKFSTYQ